MEGRCREMEYHIESFLFMEGGGREMEYHRVFFYLWKDGVERWNIIESFFIYGRMG